MDIQSQLLDLAKELAECTGELRGVNRRLDARDKQDEKIETRIKDLEIWRWKIAGIVLAASAGLGLVIKFL